MKSKHDAKYPGTRAAVDGNTAVIMCERESTDAAGAYPITPSTQMGEYFAEAAAQGHLNISQRPLIFIEPEGEHAAAAVTAGLSMTGLRASNFSSGQGIAYMHESLYAAVGKRLTYVLNIGARAMTKSTLNVHAGHDDYHCVDDTGFFQLFAKNAQHACDLNIIAHRIAELSLTPGIVAQDGFLTTHLIESVMLPERDMILEYLGKPDDLIDCPTPAQRIIYGAKRRRIPELWSVDNPVMAGVVQNQDAYMQSVASQRPFFFDHIRELTESSFAEFSRLTGRQYERVETYRCDDADYLILGQGSLIPSAEEVADYLRATRKIKVGVVNMVMFRPFPGDLITHFLKGRKGVAVLERLDQPLAEDLPLIREIRAAISKSLENGRAEKAQLPYPNYESYKKMTDMPALYSGSFGLGSRDLQPEGIIAAIENMLPDGAHRKHFYLSIDFIRPKSFTPKQEIHQQSIIDAYPKISELAIRGSENPNLMPNGSITVRFHSIGGWGAITTGKNLAMTLFELLGYHVKANPKYGSEKKGQPTTYYLSASPQPIKINCEYFFVDAVLSPDPNVFKHTNAVAGLKKGGVFIIQSDLGSPEAVWRSIPSHYQKLIKDQQIKLHYIDAFKVAREEATDSDLQLRMQGNVFQGAFFAVSDVCERAGLNESSLFQAIRQQLDHKFGSKGARVVEDNMRVVRRGFDEVRAIGELDVSAVTEISHPPLPEMVRLLPASADASTDVHRFWEQTGSFYISGKGSDNLADPFISMSLIPASTGLFRDMTGIRFQHPEWIPENCTACGKCYTVCPDTAIPGLVSEVSGIMDTVLKRTKKRGVALPELQKTARSVERRIRILTAEAGNGVDARSLILEAVDVEGREGGCKQSLQEIKSELAHFKFALTRPYFSIPEKREPGSGGLLSITVNPYTCKGCMECVQVCDDDALRPMPQTEASVARLREDWSFWLDLPTTPKHLIRVDDLEKGIGALETILLDKKNYLALSSGDGACLGCSEKTAVHLFVATVEALMQPRVAKHVSYLNDLIERLERHVQLKLTSTLDLSDPDAIARVADGASDHDLTLAEIAASTQQTAKTPPVDPQWLKRCSRWIADLKALRTKYTQGTTGQGRSSMGIINATGCSSVWGSTYPFNPYPFPWANHLFQDSASMAMGVFEGHMAKMAGGFTLIRKVELELKEGFRPERHQDALTYFTWRDFSDDEFSLCPPVVAIGGDGAMYDIGFQNLSRALMSGKPIKILVLDTQVYSNTGGQACTSGFHGQVSDMAQFGKAIKGKQEIRKEIGLIAMAHRTAYVLQSTIAHSNHMIEGFIHGLNTKRPALFNIYTSCQPEHGIGDDVGALQAKLAVQSRAYPLFSYDPDKGPRPEEGLDLEGNPEMGEDWPQFELSFREHGREKKMSIAMTFADFAVTEGRFRKHFRFAPRDTWTEAMVPLHVFLVDDDRTGKFPFIWAVDPNGNLQRVLVSLVMVTACEERRDFWTMLRAIAKEGEPEDSTENVVDRVRRDTFKQLTDGLWRLLDGDNPAPAASPSEQSANSAEPADSSEDYLAPWLETAECTSCDECININPQIFAYNEAGKAYIINPKGGPYKDIVKAAEKCTAQVIHPGLPVDGHKPEIKALIARASKYN